MINMIYQTTDGDYDRRKHYLFGSCIQIRDDGLVFQLEIGKDHGYTMDEYDKTWGYYKSDCNPIIKGG